MKNLILTLILAISMASCTTPKLIGELNLVSTRNFSLKENYVLLERYAGATKREQRKNRGLSLNGCVDNLVRSVRGGEFVQNIKIYKRGEYFIAMGDVYGIELPEKKP